MTTFDHVLVKCEVCGVDYCIGCSGERCPNCDHYKLMFYSAGLESRLSEAEKLIKEVDCGMTVEDSESDRCAGCDNWLGDDEPCWFARMKKALGGVE